MTQTTWHFPAEPGIPNLSSLNPVEDLGDDSAKSYYFRGTARYAVDRYAEAVADFKKAFELDPTMEPAKEMIRVVSRFLNAK